MAGEAGSGVGVWGWGWAPSLPSPCVLPEASLISMDSGRLVGREASSGSLGDEEALGAKKQGLSISTGPWAIQEVISSWGTVQKRATQMIKGLMALIYA